MPDAPSPVFVYGTLTDPDQVDQVLADWRFGGPARLEGLHPVDGRYPTLAPGGRTSGRLLVTPDLDALDRYEGVDRGLYVRVAVPLADEADATPADGSGDSAPGRAWLYVGDPARLEAAVDWPGGGAFAEQVRRHVEEEAVLVRRSTDPR